MFRYPANRPGRKADPYTLRTGGEHAGSWAHRAPQNRWPYRIETLTGSNPVVIVEGEKCADALAGLAKDIGVLSWLGGSGAVLRTNWESLAGRDVILWPDADGPGREGMARLAGELDRIGAAQVRVVEPEKDRPVGWDVADAISKDGWGWEETERYLLRAERVDQQECRRLRRVAEEVLVSADRIEPDRVDWIWEPYLPRGAVTLMAGAPGCGKSFLGTALAASLSAGPVAFHRSRIGKIRTAILSLEDDPARTIVPRLKACGAELGEIVIFDRHHPEADALETLSMREGTEGELLRVLREGVKLHGFRLVIIDTLTAFTPARVDGHEAVAVRQMMKPLARFASECGVGVLAVCHARKRSSHDSTHGVQATVLGSVDYVASCRCGPAGAEGSQVGRADGRHHDARQVQLRAAGSLALLLDRNGWLEMERRAAGVGRRDRGGATGQEGTPEDPGAGGEDQGQEGRDESTRCRTDPNLHGAEPGGRVFDPGTEREHRGQERHHCGRIAQDDGGKAGDAPQEGQTEGVVEPCRQGCSRANEHRQRAPQNRSPCLNRSPNRRKNGDRFKSRRYSGLPCGKPTGPRFSPLIRARGDRFASGG